MWWPILTELLLAKDADINSKDGTGDIPLHLAANKSVAELLLANGADVNARDIEGKSPYNGRCEGRTQA